MVKKIIKPGNSRGKEVEYDPQTIESKWREIWFKQKTFQIDVKNAKKPASASGRSTLLTQPCSTPDATAGKPYFNLMMFPYPSAEGLHIGNVYAFTGSDIWGRFMRMRGYDVLEPIGLDGFGIHSENYAIKMGKHPVEQAKISEANFYRQLHLIGNQFSWEQKLETYDPEYYKWTQWIFVQMFKAGLAYRQKASVNWCPDCKTVLADEQVLPKSNVKCQMSNVNAGFCERCESEVIKKDLEQWFFRITDYADRLLINTNKIDWSEKVLVAQRQWIGKSTGINITYKVVDQHSRHISDNHHQPLTITCFTTRPDTNFGATFVVISPEHPSLKSLVPLIAPNIRETIKTYIAQAKNISKEERINQGREKTGVFTGLYCLNQLTGYKMPLWISDFVLTDVGTGAVVGVPGHDLRDFEFAQKYGLEIIRVVVGKNGDKSEISKPEQVQEEEGIMINSGFLDGLEIHRATERIMDYIEKQGWGKRTSHYHLRDWLISRQRYWGPPIPMVYCKSCAEKGLSWFDIKQPVSSIQQPAASSQKEQKTGNWKLETGSQNMSGWYPIDEKNLPVLLPYVKDYRPKGTGRGPLAEALDWMKVKCPHCGADAQRETDVSDTFLDSAWYFLRYPSTRCARSGQVPWDPQITKRWLPVNMYIGGAEHSVLHLLYSRFITMFFKDQGLLDFEEPFTRFCAHGLIIKDGFKMSKSKGNIVNPDEYIAKYGADALRCYLMFIGPLSDGGDFRDTGMLGMFKFLIRVWRLGQENIKNQKLNIKNTNKKLKTQQLNNETIKQSEQSERFWIHKTIKRVTEGIQRLKYNTSLAAMMEFVNFLKIQPHISLASFNTLILLLAPFAPHMTEELWQQISNMQEEISNKKNNVSPIAYHLSLYSIHHHPWPQYNPDYIRENQVEIVVQVNGKLKEILKIKYQIANIKEEVVKLTMQSVKIQTAIQGKTIKNTIFVPGKLVNLVI